MRQAGDSTFIDLLNNLRVGALTMQQLEVIDSRRLPLTGEFDDGRAIRIYPTILVFPSLKSSQCFDKKHCKTGVFKNTVR
jgi:hypothetical protein